MKFKEWTYPLRKFDDIYYTLEKIVYTKGSLTGFNTEEIYECLRDKRLFEDAKALHNFLLVNGNKFKIRQKGEGWERYW